MLSIESLNATKDLVAILADKAVELKPCADSPLAELTSLSATTFTSGIKDLSEIDELAVNLCRMNTPEMIQCDGRPDVKEDLHSSYLSKAAVSLSTSLAEHVRHILTVVMPAVGMAHQKLLEVAESDCTVGPRAYRIESVPSSPFFELSDFTRKLEEFGNVVVPDDVALTLDYKPMPGNQVMELMKVGSEAYDAAVELFSATMGLDFLERIWTEVFTFERHAKALNDLRADPKTGQAAALGVYLIANKLLVDSDNQPEVTGQAMLSRASYGTALRTLLEASGYSVYSQWTGATALIKAGKLIDKIVNRVVYVNGPVYDKYMEEGGDVEVILGAAITSKDAYVSELTEKAEDYKSKWQQVVANEKHNASKNQLMESQRVLLNFVRQYVIENASADSVIAANIETIFEAARIIVDRVSLPDLEQPHLVACKVVCGAIYNHTQAYEFLSIYNDMVKNNPDMDTEQATTAAVTQFVCDWTATMVLVA